MVALAVVSGGESAIMDAIARLLSIFNSSGLAAIASTQFADGETIL